MSEQELGDELQIEIEDMQAPAEPSGARPAYSLFYPGRTARQR